MLLVMPWCVFVLVMTLAGSVCLADGQVLRGPTEQENSSAHTGQTAAPFEAPSGRELARVYCSACHAYPEPDLLDADTWEKGALDWMKNFMGLAPERIEKSSEAELLKQTGVFPESPIISKAHWRRIEAFYTRKAPTSPIPQPPRPPIKLGLKQFKPLEQRYRKSVAMTTLVEIEPEHHRVYVGDANKMVLDRLDSNGDLIESMKVGNMPVAIDEREGGYFLTSIGKFFPSEKAKGELIFLEPSGKRFRRRVIREELPRPTDAEFADLNQDGRTDFVLSMFGNFAGRFSWFEKLGDYQYEEHRLLDKPGAVRSEVHDFNGDGLPDIAVLMAQATESLFIFTNEGDGEFSRTRVFQKPPLYGHTFFELVDFNGDGRLDIIATNGDNGEYQPSPPKRYHGIRIYLNQGGNRFQESYFYPLNGCFKALARDYDQDGDLDIAAISYFPDYRHDPRESFVYLENQGERRFNAKTFPQCIAGRWLTMDAGDLDGDGDLDLVLGSATKGPGKVPGFLKRTWKKTGLAVMVLENTLRQDARAR